MARSKLLRLVRTAIWSMALAVFLWGACPRSEAQEALWRSYYASAQGQYQKGNFPEAQALLNDALLAATSTDESLSAYYYLAHVCTKSNQYDNAEKYYKLVLDALGTKIWSVLRPPDGAPEWEQSAIDVAEATEKDEFLAVLGHHPPKILSVKLAKPITIVDVMADFGSLLILTKRYTEAEQIYRQALILADCRPDIATKYQARLLSKLDVLYDLEGRSLEKHSVDEELSIARNTLVPDFDLLVSRTIKDLDRFGHNPHSLAIRLNNLALFCATHGDYDKAQSLFNRAISCLNEHSLHSKKDRRTILNNYSDLLLAMGRVSEANNVGHEAMMLSAGSETPESNTDLGLQ